MSSASRTLIHPSQMVFLAPVSRLHAQNPFEPAWEALMRAALRDNYDPSDGVGCSPEGVPSLNIRRIQNLLQRLLGYMVKDLERGVGATPEELAVYRGCALFDLWDEFGARLRRLVDEKTVEVPFYDAFVERHRYYFRHPGLSVPEPGHLLALLYQAWRGWYLPSALIRGGSPSLMAVRAAVWRASMASDFDAYAEDLYRRMDEIPVLITGETGTGKDAAARCIGWSSYIPFDAGARRFARKHEEDFHPRNLCEVAPELVDAALFGHKKGSFTGATANAVGFFALPSTHGSLFFDEIGESPEPVQIKLLRPLESREYVPIGETTPRKLHGRHLFATHRDLEALCREGKFRADLLERMNGIPIHMPSLRQMVDEAPDELYNYVRVFVAKNIENAARIDASTERVVEAINKTKSGYAWPRNLRELKNFTERCLVMHGSASVPAPSAPASLPPNRPVTLEGDPPNPPVTLGKDPANPPPQPVAEENVPPEAPQGTAAPESTCIPSSELLGKVAKKGELPVEEIAKDYVTRVYFITGMNQSETARRTRLSWRKVGQMIDHERLARWRAKAPKKTPAR